MASILNATTSSGLVTSADNSGSLQLATNNGTTAVTIDTNQNVGIGRTPDQRFQIAAPSAVQSDMFVGSTRTLTFYADATQTIIGAPTAVPMAFRTNDTERMRITSGGSLLVGTTSAISSGFTTISYNGTALNGLVISESANTSDTSFLAFNNGATNIGSVSRVGATSSVIYSTTSDQRLKSNIADANPVLDKLMDVKVRQFDWTEGDLHQDAGFIAQELAPVLSGIVTEGKTAEDMWQVDYSRLTPYLVKAIQELKAELDATKAEVQALKGVA